MIFYRVFTQRPSMEPSEPTWHATRDAAHAAAKSVHKDDWQHRYVEQVDVPTDKAGVLKLLVDGPSALNAQCVWSLTARGGLAVEP